MCSISGYYDIYILLVFSIHDLNQYCVPSQDTMLFIFFRTFHFIISNQYSLFHLRILCYLYLKAFSIHDFKSVLFVPPQDTMLLIIFWRFQYMILNQYCLFHLRILCYLYLKAFSIHDFKSVFVPPQDTMLFIFKGVLNSWF